MCRRAATTTTAAWVLLLLPGCAEADTRIRGDASARNLSALRNSLVWSRREAPGRFRLVQRYRGGAIRDAPVRAAARPFDADLGVGRHDGIAAVYSRCGSTCRIFKLTLRTGAETRLRDSDPGRCSEAAPSYWRGTLAFVGSGPACPRGLYVRRFAGRRFLVQRLERGGPRIVATDIRGRTVATLSRAGTRRAIGLIRFRGRTRDGGCRLRTSPERLSPPVLAGGRVLWTSFALPGFERAAARCGAPVQRARRPDGYGPLAAARGAIFYTSRGVFRADSPEPDFD